MAQLKDTIITGSLNVTDIFNINGVNILDIIYPVGYYLYTSDEKYDPNKKLKGTWERIKDKMLMAKGDKFAASGGNADGTITLSEGQLPKHSHTYSATTSPDGSHTHGMKHRHDMSNHTHSLGEMNFTGLFSTMSYEDYGHHDTILRTSEMCSLTRGGSISPSLSKTPSHGNLECVVNFNAKDGWNKKPTAGPSNNYTSYSQDNTDSGGSHTHTISGSTSYIGSGSAINIMPPYEVAICWHRTA